MQKNIYAVRDTVAQSIASGLILEALDAPAIRAFHDALANTNSPFYQHPADFELLLLGAIDMETGDILNVQPYDKATPRVIATGNGWLDSRSNL